MFMVVSKSFMFSLAIFFILFSNSAYAQSVPRLQFSDFSVISFPNTTLGAFEPSVATDSQGNVHIIWSEKLSQFVGEVFYTKIDKFGNVVLSNKQLTNISGVYSFPNSISIDKSDNIHIVWVHDIIGTSIHGIKYMRLYTNGTIAVNATFLEGASGIEIATDSQGDIFVLGTNDNGLSYVKYDNLGNILIPATTIVNSSSSWEIPKYKIAVDSEDNTYFVWGEKDLYPRFRPSSRISYSKMDSNGTLIVNNYRLDQGLNFSVDPAIAVDKNDNVYISWYSTNGTIEGSYLSKLNKRGNFEINKKPLPLHVSENAMGIDPFGNINLMDGGQSFLQLNSSGDPIIGPTGPLAIHIGSSDPKMAVDIQGKIHLVWDSRPTNVRQIDYRKSLNPATIRVIGTPKPGSQIQFVLQDIYNINGNYTFGFSGDISPELKLPDGRKIPLKDDDFLRASLYSPQVIGLIGSTGILNQYSQAAVTFNIPNIPLSGTKLYGGFVTHDLTGRIISISDPVAFTIV